MLEKISGLSRYIGTPRVSKHRIFVWCDPLTLPDSQVIVIGRDDDVTFGILQSRFHESWSLSLCTWLGVGNDPRYTPTTTFETFPFPDGLAPNCPAEGFAADARAIRVAAVSKRLDELRRSWLNPSDLVRAEPEVVPGFPDRAVPVSAEAAAILRQRTLTNLYNTRPAWLANAHADLDRAVAAAYGWPEDITDNDALSRLLDLNRARAQREQAPLPAASEPDDNREVA
jgi:type II restriction/modification system DNA methylase subunit YeeA